MTATTTHPTDRLRTFERYDCTGQALIHHTLSNLHQHGFESFEPSPAFSHALAQAFQHAFIETATIPVVPEAVDIAITEAVSRTIHQFLGKRLQSLDTCVVPFFYARVAEEFTVALRIGCDGHAGVVFTDDDHTGASHAR